MILTLIRETESIDRMGLEVPLTAAKIRQKQAILKDHNNKLKVTF